MPIAPIGQLDKFGIITDRLAYNLPPNAFSFGRNVRFRDGGVEKVDGDTPVYGSPRHAPLWGFPVTIDSGTLWIYVNLTEATATDGTNHNDVTRVDGGGTPVPYNAAASIPWSGGYFNRLPVLNNGIDVPQMWSPISINDKLQDLANWPSTLRARVLRPFKNFLFALDVSESGTRFRDIVRWSDQADPGAAPSSWDHTDPTNLAGRVPLVDGSDQLIDALPLGNGLVIYKDNTTWLAQFVGGAFVFNFRQIFSDVGMLAPRCAVRFKNRHLVLSQDDLYVHAGGPPWQSVIDGRRRREFFRAVDLSKRHNIFLVPDYSNAEVWVCFPEEGSTYATRALVWNWKSGTFGDRDLDQLAHAHWGIVNPQETLSWDSDTETWDESSEPWDTVTATSKRYLVQLSAEAGDEKFLQLKNGLRTFDGQPFQSVIERTGLAIAGQNQEGNPVVDLGSVKFVRAIYPRISVQPPGTTLKFQVGAQMQPESSIKWTAPQTFDPTALNRIPVTLSGRYLSFRLVSDTDVSWRLEGVDFDLERMSKF